MQAALAQAIYKLGKPTILLLTNGGPLAIDTLVDGADAIVEASQSQLIRSHPFCKMAQRLDLRSVLLPSTFGTFGGAVGPNQTRLESSTFGTFGGAGGPNQTRLESSMKRLKPHFKYDFTI